MSNYHLYIATDVARVALMASADLEDAIDAASHVGDPKWRAELRETLGRREGLLQSLADHEDPANPEVAGGAAALLCEVRHALASLAALDRAAESPGPEAADLVRLWQPNPAIVVDPLQLDWDLARAAAERAARYCEDVGFTAPEATEMHRLRVDRVREQVEQVVAALQLSLLPPTTPASPDRQDRSLADARAQAAIEDLEQRLLSSESQRREERDLLARARKFIEGNVLDSSMYPFLASIDAALARTTQNRRG